MRYVSSVYYFVLINKEPMKYINPSRGLRQGDPLSPYLFLIYAEGFSVLIQRIERRGDIDGVKVFRGALIVSHLFLTDDSVLFTKA